MGNMILVKKDHGVLYINPDVIGSIREMPKGMDANGREVEIRYVSGTLDFMTMAEWEQVKPQLVAGESDLHAALHEAIREGIALGKKLTEAERFVSSLTKARNAVREAQTWYDDASGNPHHIGEVSDALDSYHDKAETFFELYDEGVKPADPRPTTEVQMIPAAMAEEAVRRADALDDAGGHIKPGSGHISGFRSSQDTPPSEPESVSNNVKKIIRVERADFFSKTSNSRRAMWRMTTDDGYTVTAFDHSDPLRDHKPMLRDAGYLDMFQAYQMGSTAYWDSMPILAEIAADGKFWKLIRIEKRTALQIPDRVDTADKLKPAQLAVCKEAAAMLERDDLVVFDCETTGLAEDDEVVEIAGILLDSNRPFAADFQTLIKPTDMALLHRPGKKGKTAFDTHGIDETMLADAPMMGDPDVLNLLSEFMDKKAWASFNIEFDERLLFQGLEAAGVNDDFPEGRKNYCIQKMMNRYLGKEFVSLDEACKALGIERSSKHRAAADAEDALKVLKALAAKVPAGQPDPF